MAESNRPTVTRLPFLMIRLYLKVCNSICLSGSWVCRFPGDSESSLGCWVGSSRLHVSLIVGPITSLGLLARQIRSLRIQCWRERLSAGKEARAGWGQDVGGKRPVPHDIIPVMMGTGWGPQHRSRTQSIPYTSLLSRHTISLVRGCCSHQCYTKPSQSMSSWVCPPVHQLLASFMGTSGRLAFAASSCHLPPLLGPSS